MPEVPVRSESQKELVLSASFVCEAKSDDSKRRTFEAGSKFTRFYVMENDGEHPWPAGMVFKQRIGKDDADLCVVPVELEKIVEPNC